MTTNKNSNRIKFSEYIILALIFVAMAAMMFSFRNREFSYAHYNTSTLHYLRAEVKEIINESLSDENEYTTGYQKAVVEFREGELKGKTAEIENYITAIHNVVLKKGSHIVVCADMPEGLEPYYSVYNYDRSAGSFALIGAFLLLVIIIGRKKGFMSCVGLVFTVCMVVCVLLPELFEGGNAVVTSVLTVVASTSVSCFCIGGLTRKTHLNIISTVLGTVSAGAVYLIFMLVLNISGSNMSEAEMLSVISKSTGLRLDGILFAGVLISALGAVMDVAVSLGASLNEIRDLNPDIAAKELFKSGMNIGRDMIGTMTNTLILAFAGGTLASLIVFLSYGIQFNQLISSDFLALEIAMGISGSAAVVLTVPISAAVNSFSENNLKGR